MTAPTPIEMQYNVLQVLFVRATSGQHADASMAKRRVGELLEDYVGARISAAVLQIYLDDLIAQGLVMMPQRGVRDRYQITSKGIVSIDEHIRDASVIDSKRWTGSLNRFDISDEAKSRILVRLKELTAIIDTADLTNSEKAQAHSLVSATVIMTEAPNPPWQTVREMLVLIASISTVLTLALEIAKLIK